MKILFQIVSMLCLITVLSPPPQTKSLVWKGTKKAPLHNYFLQSCNTPSKESPVFATQVLEKWTITITSFLSTRLRMQFHPRLPPVFCKAELWQRELLMISPKGIEDQAHHDVLSGLKHKEATQQGSNILINMLEIKSPLKIEMRIETQFLYKKDIVEIIHIGVYINCTFKFQ